MAHGIGNGKPSWQSGQLKFRPEPADGHACPIPQTRTAVFNFSSAIQAHTNWKLRLATNCKIASLEKIDVAALAKDNVCALGKWLHGDGRAHVAHARFRELVDAHAAFHRSAAALAALIERGKREEAAALINSRDSEFGKLSLRVVAILMALRSELGDG